MFNHPYILLSVKSELDRPRMLEWYNSVNKVGPNGVCSTAEISPNNKQVKFYLRKLNGMNAYVVVLSRNLLGDEANKIAEDWDKIYPDEDFEIEWSQDPEMDMKHESIKNDVLKSIILEAAKRAHSTWLNKKVTEGWRYGIRFNPEHKVSPMCMTWENLSEKHKQAEYARMLGLIEVINEMGLNLVKKS